MEDLQRQRWCWQSRALEWLPLLQPAVPWGASGCSQRSELLLGWVQLVQQFPERGLLVRNRLVNGSDAHLTVFQTGGEPA